MKTDINSFEYKLDNGEIENIIQDLKNNNDETSYLLDISKSDLTLIEKCIYDIALYQLEANEIQYNENTHSIEFIFKKINKLNNFNKYNNSTKESPLLSNILYLNNDIFPTMISSVKNKDVVLSFPKKGKVISFDSNKYYGIINVFNELDNFEEQYIILINIWSKTQNFFDKYISLQFTNKYNKNENLNRILKTNNIIENIKIDNDLLNDKFFNNLFHSGINNNDVLYTIGDKIKQQYGELLQDLNTSSTIHIFSNAVTETSNSVTESFTAVTESTSIVTESSNSATDLSNNLLTNDYMYDYNNIKNNIVSNDNRFIQKLLINNLYDADICNWMLKEMIFLEKDEEKDISYVKNVDELPFFGFIIGSIRKLIDKIIVFYNINLNNRNVNIKKIFFSKRQGNDKNDNNILNTKDDGFLTIDILLNDVREILFNNNIKYVQEIGDVIIYCNLLTNYRQILNDRRYSINIIIDFE